ncbi:hypothetical protein [Lentibacillus amyloliquefaciens]|uniref:hypothetical protein n=1 Tax=Lentibacillus amyloliquefaciens TaxID=1472767 RepID=UPI0014701F35|nr:hypothetical protein [Lentibacillus amyloliquefaciens]
MNVDYIPVLSDWSMTETHEFLLHLTVSVFIVFGLYFVLRRTRASIILFVLGTVIIGGCYYPLTVLSGGHLM